MLLKFLLPGGRIPEQGLTREGKEAWQQEMETQAVPRKEGGVHGRSLRTAVSVSITLDVL